MRTPAFHRTWKRVRWAVTAPVAYSARGIRWLTGESESYGHDWNLAWVNDEKTRWRRGSEILECYAFDDGYLTTVSRDERDATWQLTAGPVPLGTALAAAALYLQHDLPPQFDRDGRPFVGVADDAAVQVFEESTVDPAQYVYLDGIRTLEEFPPFLDHGADVSRAFKRMSTERRPRLSNR